MPEVDTKFALMLTMVDGIGPVRHREIVKHFPDFDRFADNTEPDIFSNCGLNPGQVSAIMRFDRWSEIDKIMEKAARLDVKIISLGQSGYPQILNEIYMPPPVLYLKGEHQILSKPSVAVVGSRTPTGYGRSMTRKIAAGLAARGLVIISGLAWGIDAEAHRSALDAGGITVAVFGSGIDIVYPAEHRSMADRIIEKGVLVSEFPFGTEPERHNFPRRNRIISGLARAVVVVEAAQKSGALVTAQLALEQGKDIFAVPGQADNPKSHGALNLLKQGASIATSAEDVLESFGWEVSSKAEANEAPSSSVELDQDEQKICDIVGMGPAHFDELVRRTGYQPSRISSIILKLELAGLIVKRPGNYVARV